MTNIDYNQIIKNSLLALWQVIYNVVKDLWNQNPMSIIIIITILILPCIIKIKKGKRRYI